MNELSEHHLFALAHPTVQGFGQYVLSHPGCSWVESGHRVRLEARLVYGIGWCWCASISRLRSGERRRPISVGKLKPRWRAAIEQALHRLVDGVGVLTVVHEELLPAGIQVEQLNAMHRWRTMSEDEISMVSGIDEIMAAWNEKYDAGKEQAEGER